MEVNLCVGSSSVGLQRCGQAAPLSSCLLTPTASYHVLRGCSSSSHTVRNFVSATSDFDSSGAAQQPKTFVLL